MAELTLVFTDIADSTAVVERLGAEGAAELWSKHDDATRVLFERYHGREIDRTDGFFVVFESTYDAARFALEYQTVVRRLSLHARIGIHRGTVALRSNSADAISRGAKGVEIEGVAKPMAARVMALASPGQTLLSAAAQTALGDRLPVDAEIMCHGHFRLKGVEEPIEIFQLAASTTSLFAPPADAEKAYRVVKSGELWRPARDIPNNLLSERDGFVGRGIDLRTIAGRFEGGTRLLTLVGPGGTGKTRLATRYARAWLGSWPGGVYFCDLSDARSLEGIYYAVGGALQVQLGKEDPTDQIARAISTRGQCLFILDNFEQVVEHAAITVGRWADRAALAAFLVTSRERLHLQGESVLPIGPLSLADDAVDLFVLRTQAQRAEFSLTEANLSPVREIVRLLDGLPLAIELAAARMGVFSAVQLATRLKHRFEVLVVPRRGPDRQATLETTIDWSWNLLNVDEQSALAQCSVFEGGFTLEAAEQVICLPAATGGAVSQALQALVDKSLLRAWVPARASRGGSDGLRFGAYMSVHEYVSGKLRESDRSASLDIDVRHGRYFGHFGTDEYLDLLSERAGDEHRSELALELDNLIAAFRRATNRGDSEVAASAFRASWEVLEQRGPLSTAAAMADQVLVLPQLKPETRLAADLCAARALWRIGRTGEAVPVLEQALHLSRGLNDQRREANALSFLASVHREQGHMDEARIRLEAALAVNRSIGNRRAEGMNLGNLGNLLLDQGNLAEAQQHYDAALAIARAVGNRPEEGLVLGNLSNLHADAGRGGIASELYSAALEIHRETGNRRAEANVLANLASHLDELGQTDEARISVERALQIHREIGNRRNECVALITLSHLCQEQGALSEAQDYAEAAVSLAIDVGDRRHQAAALAELATVLTEEADFERAEQCFHQAVDLHRAVGSRPMEAVALLGLGELMIKQRRLAEAGSVLQSGEEILRQTGSAGVVLGQTLCALGSLELMQQRRELASRRLQEAAEIAATLGVRPDSSFARRLERLRAACAEAHPEQ